jgi:hypothetical protein
MRTPFSTATKTKIAQQWTIEQAWKWYERVGWRQGANFLPSSASNQLEMFLGDLDLATIDRELGWAADLNYNTLRVFLHNLLHQHQGDEFLVKVDKFLDLAQSHGMKTILVLFDGCWDPRPNYGPQEDPRAHVHNSRWLQAPGREVLANESCWETLLKPYVGEVVKRFGNDDRVLLLDLFNEPDNSNANSYGTHKERVPAAQDAKGSEMDPFAKATAALKLVHKTFEWARSVGPIQVPLTIAQWAGQDDDVFMNYSDVVTFHNYGDLDRMRYQVQLLRGKVRRPIICTEWMARTTNSTFDPILGYLYSEGVWAVNWGFVAGRMQTQYPWDSWQDVYDSVPALWHHDVMYPNGTAYNEKERLYLLSYQKNKQTLHRHHESVGALSIAPLILLTVVTLSAILLRVKHCFWRYDNTALSKKNLS